LKINKVFLIILIFISNGLLAQTNPKPTPGPSPQPIKAMAGTKNATTAKPTPIPKALTPADSSNYTPPTYVSPSKLGGGRDLYDVPKVTALANKKFYLNNEVTLNLTYLATDPFYKYIAGGGSYTHAYNHFWGWEVLNGGYAISFASGLYNNLVNTSTVHKESSF
jgi:hypothetical protein